MQTSYFNFARINALPENHLVSIAAIPPEGFKGRQYKKLAPKYAWWRIWREGGKSEEWYSEHYYATVLRNLDPGQVFSELGEDSILLCYEKSGELCHRRLAAKWMETALGVIIPEISLEELPVQQLALKFANRERG